jgi:hypothetical protein
VFAASQRLIGRAVFEWGNVKTFSGVLNAKPVPHLVVNSAATNRSYFLVRPWKFGFEPSEAAKFDGQPVTLKGTLIYRDDQAMIEVKEISARGKASPSHATSVSLGEQTFVGEIVDSKCFLGVMNPGQLKPHRACAIRCISGGVPPVLLLRESDGTARYLLLVSRDGQPVNREVLDFVAEPVRVSGELRREGDLLVLRTDPTTIQRIP